MQKKVRETKRGKASAVEKKMGGKVRKSIASKNAIEGVTN